MRYNEALAFLDTPNFMNPDPGLENIQALLEELGNPQDALCYVHIAGTNGKGSTAAFTERILRESGYRTGMYTSPYIDHFSEKIRVDGEEISKEAIVRLASVLKEAAEAVQKKKGLIPTVFELVTALVFLYFKEQRCDIVVLEVGLGGRLDATNIIKWAEVSVITAIGLDHTDILGDTEEKIAREKAGIIKFDSNVVLYEQKKSIMDVIASVCREKNSVLTIARGSLVKFKEITEEGQVFSFGRYQDLKTGMLGVYQMRNAVTAVCVAETLRNLGWKISEQAIRNGLAKARWQGRLEVCGKGPMFLVDAAHNPQGVQVLAESLKVLFPERKFIFVVGVLGDKAYEKMIDTILPLAESFHVVTPNSTRALAGETLKDILVEKGSQASAYETIEEAVDAAKKEAMQIENGMVCAFGSLYYIGDVIACLKRRREAVRTMDMKEQKKVLRQQIREKQKSLSANYCKTADLTICQRILALSEYANAKTMFCFVGTKDEINTEYLLRQAWKDGKRTIVPRCAAKGIMDAYEITSMDDLEEGQYGIREPKDACPKVEPDEIDFAVIPCMSCDEKGYRLGHGGGYYDRYLEHTDFATAVVCREELMLPEVPVDIYDKQMDWVISEKKTIKV